MQREHEKLTEDRIQAILNIELGRISSHERVMLTTVAWQADVNGVCRIPAKVLTQYTGFTEGVTKELLSKLARRNFIIYSVEASTAIKTLDMTAIKDAAR